MALHLEPCLAPFWARSGHQQTLLGKLLPSRERLPQGELVRIPLADGDQLLGSFLPGKGATILYLFHGLAGDGHSPYMRRTAIVGQNLGCGVFVMNHRGCGEGARYALLPYHAGRAADLSAVISLGRQRFPSHQHIAIGFSLGGCMLLNLLTGAEGFVTPDRALCVNAPLLLEKGVLSLRKGWNRVYDSYFVNSQRITVSDRIFRHTGERRKISRLTSTYDLDEIYVAPASGFLNREHYYRVSSPQSRLDRITVPTQLITSADDPMIPVEDYQEAKLSPQVSLHIEGCGGHLGYLTRKRTPLGTYRWLDYAIDTFLRTTGCGATT